MDEDGRVVGPLQVVLVYAAFPRIRAVPDVADGIDQAYAGGPVVRFLRPDDVRLVAGVAGEAGCELEEGTVGDGVHVVVASVLGEDLPA